MQQEELLEDKLLNLPLDGKFLLDNANLVAAISVVEPFWMQQLSCLLLIVSQLDKV